MAYWLFQGNPKYYRVIDSIRDFAQMPWSVTRYGKEMQPGDGVLIWVSGAEAGIYAIAEIIGHPQQMPEPPDIGYWQDRDWPKDKPHISIRFTSKLLAQPLLKSRLKADPVLQKLMVIRQPNSTNYRVTPTEWQRVHELKAV